VILGLALQVFENALLPVLLHEVPVAHDTVTYGILDRVAGRVLRLVADEEVEVVQAASYLDANSLLDSDRFIFIRK
jgi:hypothetical protein